MSVIGTVEEVLAERFRQRDELGFTEEHDDRIGLQGFGWLLASRATGLCAPRALLDQRGPEDARRVLVEIAAIAVAAIESIDRQADA